MGWFFVLVGVVFIVLGLLDVLLTVLHYDGFGFISGRVNGVLFRVVRFFARPLPGKFRALALSMAAPLMVPATIAVWILLVALGYACVYFAGMMAGSFSLSVARLEPSFAEALYFSGTAISTLGLGDVTPVTGAYQLVAVSEALVGFGILTLAISYVVGLYGVLQQLGVMAAGLYHQAQDTDDPWTILAPHFPGGEPRALESHLMELHRGLVEIYEGMRRYPLAYYYHSRRAYRSLPYTFRMTGGLAGALRWGLPADHPATRTPWLPALLTGLSNIADYFADRFLSGPLGEAPEPVPFRTFEPALAREAEPDDWFLGRFLEMEGRMRELARVPEPPEAKEAYVRYQEWLPFTHRSRSFFEATAKDLGYEIEDLARNPGERLF